MSSSASFSSSKLDRHAVEEEVARQSRHDDVVDRTEQRDPVGDEVARQQEVGETAASSTFRPGRLARPRPATSRAERTQGPGSPLAAAPACRAPVRSRGQAIADEHASRPAWAMLPSPSQPLRRSARPSVLERSSARTPGAPSSTAASGGAPEGRPTPGIKSLAAERTVSPDVGAQAHRRPATIESPRWPVDVGPGLTFERPFGTVVR